METMFTEYPRLVFRISPQKTEMFTSLLQAGVQMDTTRGCPIGVFLEAIPGFTAEYITDQVQTIFLNGTATDDLETPLEGKAPVLAISAAMPGLAGAIFRRNSLHAALRTTKEKRETTADSAQITVTLKLFNAIARDRGLTLLERGITIKAESVCKFLETRTTLIDCIGNISFEKATVRPEELLTLLSTLNSVHLSIIH